MTDEVFNDEGLVQNLTTAVLTPEEKASLMKESAKRLGAYRSALIDLEEQLDGFARDLINLILAPPAGKLVTLIVNV